MRIAILGFGSIGRRHFSNLKKLGYSDILVFDPSKEACTQAELDFGARSTATLNVVWDWGPAIVLIAAPSHQHIGLALEAAKHGCHLFVEKPLSHTLTGMVDLESEVAKRKLITMVGCNMRFHPGPTRVKALLDDCAIGRILFARIFSGSYLPEWRPWQDYRKSYSANTSMGGGCILDGIHEIDLACWYTGPVVSVAALASHVSHLELNAVEDVASLILRHQDGQHSEVHLDYVQRVRIRGCVIAGSEGTITWEWTDHHVHLYRTPEAHWTSDALPAAWEVNQMYLDEMAHFMDAVLCKKLTCNPIEEASVITRVALAARESSAKMQFVELQPRS
jgi:predicted dehydrogenase